jgi:hypothetical protein
MSVGRWCSSGAVAALVLVLAAGVSRANAPAGRYTAANGTVYDAKTALTWQQAAPTSTYTWGTSATSGTAQNYCATLGTSGGGWRLPTMKELQTLIDYSQAGVSSAMIDTVFFPNTPAGDFWAATPVAGAPGVAWVVNFRQGNLIGDTVTTKYYVRCVR